MKTMASTPFKTIAILGKVLDETGYKFVIEDTFIDFDGKQFTIRGSSQPSQPEVVNSSDEVVNKVVNKVVKPQTQDCKHCGGDIKIRNPKGFCDHLLYPEYCKVCSQPQTSEGSWIKEFKKISDIFYGFHEVVDDHTKKECDCFPLLVSKLERFTSDLLARERRDVVESSRAIFNTVHCKNCQNKAQKLLDDLTREESK